MQVHMCLHVWVVRGSIRYGTSGTIHYLCFDTEPPNDLELAQWVRLAGQ